MPSFAAAASSGVPAASSSSSLVAKSGSWLVARSSASSRCDLVLHRLERLRLLGHDLGRRAADASRTASCTGSLTAPSASAQAVCVQALGQVALGQRSELRALDAGILQRRGHRVKLLPGGHHVGGALDRRLVAGQQLLELALLGRAVGGDALDRRRR